MVKLAIVLVTMLISLVIRPQWAQALDDGPNQVNWAKKLDGDNEIQTNLHFYFHDTVSGKNPSAERVAQASDTGSSLTRFGMLMMADDPLTDGPNPSSKLVGRVQGMYGSGAQNNLGLIMAMNYAFIDGIYNGSSISVLGLNNALYQVHELAIVGGTGLFRLARGYAIAQTYKFNPLTSDAIVEGMLSHKLTSLTHSPVMLLLSIT